MIRVDIQVDNGKVTISIGGQASTTSQASTNAKDGQIVAQGTVGARREGEGGDAGDEDTGIGGGGPGSGALVIGPIVIDGSLAQRPKPQAGARKEGEGGDAGDEDTGIGGGGPGSGCVVIGPIVVCGRGKSGAGGTSGGSTPVDRDPKKDT
jgi:hypothetical protein